MAEKKQSRIIAQNKKAYHDFFVEETYEAGIELSGTEVKSLRRGNANLKDSFCRIEDGEIFAYGIHISPYEQGNVFNCDPFRVRKLLMHKHEISRLQKLSEADGMSLIPLCVYIKDGRVKIELAVAKGKKLYDKRHALAQKDAQREIERKMREKY